MNARIGDRQQPSCPSGWFWLAIAACLLVCAFCSFFAGEIVVAHYLCAP
jgi:hypothetical protein